MTLPSADDSLLRRYLLGSVAPENRETLEARVFSDQVFWERLCIVEDELLNDYLENGLNDEEKKNFEAHFLSTAERRAKLEFARALRTYAERSGSSGQSRWHWLRHPVAAPAWAIAAAALLVLLAQIPRFTSGGAGGDAVRGTGVVAVALAPGLTRAAGDELTRVRLSTDSRLLRLQLEPATTMRYEAYRATLHLVDGDEVIAEMKLTPSDAGIALTLPTEILAEGDYYVRLHGLSPGASPIPLQRYDFRVLRD